MIGVLLSISFYYILVAIYIFIMEKRALYLRYLGALIMVVAVTRFMEPFVTPESEGVCVARLAPALFFTFLQYLIPFLIVLTVISLVRSRDEIREYLRWTSGGGLLVALIMTAVVAVTWPSAEIWSISLALVGVASMGALVSSIVRLVRARRAGGRDRFRIDVVLIFMVVNLTLTPVVVLFHYYSSQPNHLIAEAIMLAINGFLLTYLVLHKEPQESMRASYNTLRREFESLMMYAGDGIALLDLDGNIISSNIRLRTLSGLDEDGIKGTNILALAPKGYSPLISTGLSICRRGAVAQDMKFRVVREGEEEVKGPDRAGHEEDQIRFKGTHVLSTFSPVLNDENEVEGILVIMRDITPIVQLEIERVLRARAMAQNRLQRVLTRILPMMLMMAGPARGRCLSIIIDKVEEALGFKMMEEYKKNGLGPDRKGGEDGGDGEVGKDGEDRNGTGEDTFLADYLCKIMFNLGGAFYWEPITVDDGGVELGKVFYGLECPWGEEPRQNPVLCNLCRGIFTRLVGRRFEEARVELVSTMGKGDKRCAITAYGMIGPRRKDSDEGSVGSGDRGYGMKGKGIEEVQT